MKKLNPFNLPIKDIFLSLLMSRPVIERMPRLKLLPEQALTVRVADMLRLHTIHRRLKGVWFHIPNEGKRTPYDGAVIKAMGRIPGAPDFIFIGEWGSLLIELKVDSPQSEPQQYFEYWCKEQRVRYVICRAVDEVENILRECGAL
jgi:hypothetical protein